MEQICAERHLSASRFAWEAIRRQAMVPDHIDDLPRRDDDYRQLMLGLIDDLPQERRHIRQLVMWGSLSLAVVLFVVLV